MADMLFVLNTNNNILLLANIYGHNSKLENYFFDLISSNPVLHLGYPDTQTSSFLWVEISTSL